jgi:hypothetical protein
MAIAGGARAVLERQRRGFARQEAVSLQRAGFLAAVTAGLDRDGVERQWDLLRHGLGCAILCSWRVSHEQTSRAIEKRGSHDESLHCTCGK